MNHVCPFCESHFGLNDLMLHLKSQHKFQKKDRCDCCHCKHSFSDIYNYLKHLKKEHSDESSINTPKFNKNFCLDDNLSENHHQPSECSPPLKKHKSNNNSLKAHYLATISTLLPILTNSVSTQTKIDPESFADKSTSTTHFNCNETDSQLNEKLQNYSRYVHQIICDFVVKIYSKAKIPRSYVVEIVNLVTKLCREILDNVVESIDIPPIYYSYVNSIILLTRNAVKTFNTEHSTMTVFKNIEIFVAPKSILLKNIYKPRLINKRRKMTFYKVTIEIISIILTLEKFLSLPRVLELLLEHLKKFQSNLKFNSPLQGQLWVKIKKI